MPTSSPLSAVRVDSARPIGPSVLPPDAISTTPVVQVNEYNSRCTNLFVYCILLSVTSENPASGALEALRAIAHPVRIQIYELLTLDGPSNVSQVATKINLAVGSASYHLAQLQQAGFIEEATDISADRRTRWWRAVPGGLNWSPADYLASASGREVSTQAQRLLTERRVRRLVEWNSSWHQWSKSWIEAAVESDAILQLTAEELAGMTAELSAVVRKWVALTDDASSDTTTSRTSASGRELVFLLLSAFPVKKGR